ncbi:B12-binding domain-containing radical SAM protein [Bradyrhizobium liaoningense]|uniref:B12-binding domain-containing radical SAM protein n=1 Tax=Bradyrhizobium liaoningense TaxID=43992 RepID=UPI001BADCE5B|nr:radical SAM protein [Bradyrhizobium liaoningense]MBR0707007.1 radical SAM protein [Bradyrhizobium liaoningense]
MPTSKTFRLVLIKPSHYDSDGYVIRWWRGGLPSNSLACLHGIALDCRERQVLGAEFDIDIEAIDETNRKVRVGALARAIKTANAGMVMLVGVQSNQFPRAIDIAREFRSRGIQVAVGGFHVSGTLAMLPNCDPDVRKILDLGVSVFAGEAEGRLEHVLKDAVAAQLQPQYNFLRDLPHLEGQPLPIIPREQLERVMGRTTSFDAGRGCPFQCSFCTIINVQGRKSRRRTPDDIEALIRVNVAQGIHAFFITDDNFARNKDWEVLLDRIIELREKEGWKLSFTIQVDTLCHKLPNFVEKCARAGVRRCFIGLENINPDSLFGAKKRQNKITDYREMMLAWKQAKIVTVGGYILGFPGDTLASIVRDIKIIQDELPIDMLEFFFLTPLPGSEDHKTLYSKGVAMDPDLNKYDLDHVTVGHATMSQDEWENAYAMAWTTYYSWTHIETIMRRAAATGNSVNRIKTFVLYFKGYHPIEHVHPLEGGVLRLKSRCERRPHLPTEPVWLFYPRLVIETMTKAARWATLAIRLEWLARRVKGDPHRLEHADKALTCSPSQTEGLELFKTRSSQAFLDHRRHIEEAQRRKSPVS